MPNSFRIGEFHVEPPLYRVSGPAGTVRLEPKVMQVLLCLAEHAPQVQAALTPLARRVMIHEPGEGARPLPGEDTR